MHRSSLVALVFPLLGALGACTTTEVVTTEIPYPVMVLSQSSLEFGDADFGATAERTMSVTNDGCMPMGIGEVSIGNTGGESFSVAWSASDIECPAERPTSCPALEESAPADTAAAKAVDIDTGGDDTGTTTDTGTTGVTDPGASLVLDPGCTLPLTVRFTPAEVGDIWGSMKVIGAQAELPADAEEGDLPEYLRDPEHWEQIVYLHGASDQTSGTLVVRPRSYDYGFVHPDDTEPEEAFIEVQNVGDGDIVLTSVLLAETCDAAFTLADGPPDNYTLSGGESTVVQVDFDPIDDEGAYCQLIVASDDLANPELDVTFTGNSGSDPNNQPPTVAIRWPDNGYKYSTVRDLEMEINIFDVNQPADSLTCRVKSAVLLEASIADCAASDKSGHVFVTVPRENLDPGIDTLVVTVTDGNGLASEASVSILVNTDYPADDDDGDGYSATGDEVYDCDDTNRYTYPEAAEIYDGDDNDCDGLIDEDTIGFDDDGDSVSEVEGDCNDYDETAYPGAPERGDGVDNDCDGVVDEGTSLYDDDGDGYAEVNNDCNDNNPDVSPAADEECDGIDNDCDGLIDSADGCQETDSLPIVVGDAVRALDANACESGDVITLEVKPYDADGQVPTIQWQDDSGVSGNFDNANATVVHWTCPELPEDSGGKAYSVYATVADPDGNVVPAFTRIAVYPKGYGLHDDYERTEIVEVEGCSSTGGSPATGLAVAGLALALASRRRQRVG